MASTSAGRVDTGGISSATAPPHLKRLLSDQQCIARAGLTLLADPPATEPTLTQYALVMHGPAGTPYEGGQWRVRFTMTPEYPFRSPSVGFVDPIWHPNVERNGSICLNALNSAWLPATTVPSIVEVVLPALLALPNPSDPFNQEAAAQMTSPPRLSDSRAVRTHKERTMRAWEATVREHCRRHAWKYTPPVAAAAGDAAAAASAAASAATGAPAPASEDTVMAAATGDGTGGAEALAAATDAVALPLPPVADPLAAVTATGPRRSTRRRRPQRAP